MSVSDNYAPDRSIGNGVTTVFTGDWAVLSQDWFYAQLEEISTGTRTDLVQGVDYTVTVGESGYSMTTTTAPTSGQAVIRYRQTPMDQTNPYTTAKGFQGRVIENSLDKAAIIDQELSDGIGRSLKFRIGDDVPDLYVAVPVDGRSLKYDEASGSFVPTTEDPDLVAAEAEQFAVAAEEAAGDSEAAKNGSEAARDEAVAAKEAVEEALQSLTQATETVSGISRQATIAEATSGESTTPTALPHVTPEGVAAALAPVGEAVTAIGERTTALEASHGITSTSSISGLSQYILSGVPSGVTKLRLRLQGINQTSLSITVIRVSTSSGEVTSGYAGSGATWGSPATYIATTDSIVPSASWSVNTMNGHIDIERLPGTNLWVWSCTGAFGTGFIWGGGGTFTAADIASLRLFVGAGTWSAGNVSLEWWK